MKLERFLLRDSNMLGLLSLPVFAIAFGALKMGDVSGWVVLSFALCLTIMAITARLFEDGRL